MKASTVDLEDISAITLMGTDVERVVFAFQSIHELWSSILDISIAIWLLERQLSVACIAPVVIISSMHYLIPAISLVATLLIKHLVFIAATFKLASSIKNAQRQWIEKIDERLRVTSNMLGDMKAVKMLGFSDVISSMISGLRKTEIDTSKRYRKLLIAELLLCELPMLSAQHLLC